MSNHQQHIIITKATGSLTAIELLRFVDEVWSSAELPVLLDATESSTAHMSGEDIRRVADTARSHRGTSRPRARLAIAVTADEDFGFARMFQSLVDATGANVRVFRSLAGAKDWLR